MSSPVRLGACALIAAGALAMPAAAGAADIQTAVSAVTAHTDRADTALDRAVAQFAGGSDRAARKAYATSRKEMGLAKAALGKARRLAVTPDEHAAAAAAAAVLGTEQGENIDKLAKVLVKTDAADQNAIASAARADTQGREKAIAILTALLGQVPDQAKTGIAKAIAALSVDRADETSIQAKALTSSKVSKANKLRVAATIKLSVDGQDKVSDTLAALIASTTMPSESKPGLQKAYDAVTADHGSVASILSRLSDNMPAFVRTFVEKIITQARTDAQGMRENHPTGPPAGTPGGPPATITPGGAPAGTPGPGAETPGPGSVTIPAGPLTSIPGPPAA